MKMQMQMKKRMVEEGGFEYDYRVGSWIVWMGLRGVGGGYNAFYLAAVVAFIVLGVGPLEEDGAGWEGVGGIGSLECFAPLLL